MPALQPRPRLRPASRVAAAVARRQYTRWDAAEVCCNFPACGKLYDDEYNVYDSEYNVYDDEYNVYVDV